MSVVRNRRGNEARELIEVLDRTNWKVKSAADILGIDKTTVYRQLERLGMSLRPSSNGTTGDEDESRA